MRRLAVSTAPLGPRAARPLPRRSATERASYRRSHLPIATSPCDDTNSGRAARGPSARVILLPPNARKPTSVRPTLRGYARFAIVSPCVRIVFLAGVALLAAGCAAKKPASANAYFNMASRELSEGSYGRAVDDYRTLLDEYPFSEYSEEAELKIGVAHYKNGSCPRPRLRSRTFSGAIRPARISAGRLPARPVRGATDAPTTATRALRRTPTPTIRHSCSSTRPALFRAGARAPRVLP
jgi:hypothetical protein